MTINISEELPARNNAPAVAAKSAAKPDAKKGDAKGGTPQENSAKRIRQAVYDIRYRARREDVDLRKAYSQYMANSNLSPQEKTAVREKLFGKQGGGVSEQYSFSSIDWAEKNFADAYHKVFFEGLKKEEPPIQLPYEQELAEEQERKYKVRVFDPNTEKSYVRFATREKISRLRAKGLKVEMTEHGEAYEGEKKKGEQTAAAMGGGEKKKKDVKEGKLDPVGKEDGDVNNDGKEDDTDDYLMNRRKAVGKAIAKKKGKKNVSEQSAIDEIKRLRKKAGVDYENDPNMVNTAPGIYRSKSAIEADKPLQQRLKELPSNVKRRQVDAAREKRMMAAPIPEAVELIADGATGTTSTEGQNARTIDILPEKVAKKLQQVTVMPQDGTNPQAGKAPLMMSQQMEGDLVDEQAYTDPKYAERPQGVPYKDLKGFKPSAFKDMKQYPATLGGKKGMMSGDEGARGRSFRQDPEDHDRAVKQIEKNKMQNRNTSGRAAGRAAFTQNNSYEPEGGQLTEEEKDRRERYAFMNVARNLVRAKTGAKRPIAMDPEGTYKKAKEDLAKMVNSDNPDKDKKETPCEEKQLSMADTFLSIASAPKEDTEQLDEFLGPQAAENVKTLLDRGRRVFDRLGIPNNKTKKPMPGSGTPDTQSADKESRRMGQNRMRQAGY